MRNILFAVALFILSAASAYASNFMLLHVGQADGSGAPAPTGDILLADGTSFILQTDGASLICIAGGC